MENQKLLRNLNSKGRYLTLLLTVTVGLLYCSSALAGYGFYSDGAWNMRYWNGSADKWFPNESGYSMGAEYNLGVISSSYYINGVWVNTYAKDGDCVKWVQISWSKDNSTWSRQAWGFYNWECKSGDPVTFSSVDQSQTLSIKLEDFAVNNPGKNTLYFYFDVQNYNSSQISSTSSKVGFTLPGYVTTSSSTPENIGSSVVGTSVKKQNISLGTHYGDSDGTTTATAKSGDTGDFSVTCNSATSVDVTFTPTAVGTRTAVFTITDKYGKTRTLTVTGTGNNTPTVLIGAKESVSDENVTLNGYIKYTGCETVSSYGFVYGLDEGGEPTYDQQAVAGTSDVPAGTDFSTTFAVQESGTYNYRAYMTTSGGTYYSEERRQFTVDVACDITTTVDATFEDNKTESSATYVDGSASIGLKTTNHAKDFLWECTNSETGSTVTIESPTSRNTTVTVDKIGTYTFHLKGRCEVGTGDYKVSETLTLYVCAPAEETQLYLDNHTNNVLCVGEKATATCITKEGYTYSLYSPSGDNLGSLAGTGATQTWRNVTGAGEFTMRTSPTEMPQCAAVVSSATQSYNEPTMEITADPGLSVLSYQPVTLSKKDIESPTYVDTNPTWVITNGSDKAYLLNEHNRLAYDNRARESVVFKAGAGIATQITVEASAFKTAEVEDSEAGNYTKQCPTTVDVTLTVSPAEDDCDN